METKPIRQAFTAPNGIKVTLRMRERCEYPTYFFRIGREGAVKEVVPLVPVV